LQRWFFKDSNFLKLKYTFPAPSSWKISLKFNDANMFCVVNYGRILLKILDNIFLKILPIFGIWHQGHWFQEIWKQSVGSPPMPDMPKLKLMNLHLRLKFKNSSSYLVRITVFTVLLLEVKKDMFCETVQCYNLLLRQRIPS